MSKYDQNARQANIEAICSYFKSGIKDTASNIGIEIEHTLVHEDGRPVSYSDDDGQENLLGEMASEYEETQKTHDGHLIGLTRKGESITLEPAAQLELSAGPFESLASAKSALDVFEGALEKRLSGTDIEVLTPGYHPTMCAADLKLIPKTRYKFMNEYLGSISMYGICMMRGSAATQVAIDYTSQEDCLRKLRLASACVPILSLICDNTPVFEAEERPHQLMRTEIWEKCDPDRCNLVPGIMDSGFSLEDYAEYILDTPAIVDISTGSEIYTDKTFGEIYAERAMEKKDVEHALSMFFTDVRLKTYIEIRPADAMPHECVLGYAALIKGLFYGKGSLDALDDLFEGITGADVMAAKKSLMADGYAGSVYGHAASTYADELISIAKTGLSDEDLVYLEPIAELVAARTTLAEIALEQAGN